MRMNNIPRALQSNNDIESIELGSGMRDRRVNHISEEEWLNNNDNNPDPRFSRSDYHDPISKQEKREKSEIEEVELASGYIVDAIMYPEGAHLKIKDGDNIYFIFIPETNFVVIGTMIKVIDKVVITTYNSINETNPITKEVHSLDIVEIEDNKEKE